MTAAALPPQALRNDAKVIGLVSVAHGVSHFFHLILAPLFPWLKTAFGLSYAELGLLMTGFFVVSGFAQAAAGFVVDRIGARTVLFGGLGCLALAALVLSTAQHYAMLMAGSMLAGLGNSVFHPADFTLLNRGVSTRRLGHAFSVHGIAGNLGWAAAPVFLAPIAATAGWRIALLGAACIPLAVIALLAANRHALAAPAETTAARDAATQEQGSAFDFLRLPAIWACFAFFVITAMALGGIQSFAAAGLRAMYGLSLGWSTAAYTGYMLASAVGMLWGGFLAAKTTRHDRTIALGFSAAGVMALVVATGAVPPLLAVFLMGAIGFGAGVANPSRDLLIRGAAPKNATGRVYGVVYSGFDIGLSTGPLLFGALMDAHRPAMVFLLIGIFQLVAILTAVGIGSRTARKAMPAGAAKA
ncbi:MAG: MFS transporter [Burkholderiaceae bacterium]